MLLAGCPEVRSKGGLLFPTLFFSFSFSVVLRVPPPSPVFASYLFIVKRP